MYEYIDREAFLKWAREFYPNDKVFASAIINAPAADVATVVHGRWNVVEGLMIDNAICSNCGRRFQAYYKEYHFCPNCGAKMNGGAEC